MTFFNHCRRCGHTNLPTATVCAACHQSLDTGIRQAMICPVCGAPNGSGAQTCAGCAYDLEKVEQTPADQRTVICPLCHTANPPPVQSDAAAYCIQCGREIQLPGSDYSLADFTPNKEVCPRCATPVPAVTAIHGQHASPLADLFVPPALPALLRQEGMSPTAPPGQDDVESPSHSDAEGTAARIWASEVAAVRSILGVLGEDAVDARRLTTARYREALDVWNHAYYCATDIIVFARRLHAVRTWTPHGFAAEMRQELLPGVFEETDRPL